MRQERSKDMSKGLLGLSFWDSKKNIIYQLAKSSYKENCFIVEINNCERGTVKSYYFASFKKALAFYESLVEKGV